MVNIDIVFLGYFNSKGGDAVETHCGAEADEDDEAESRRGDSADGVQLYGLGKGG